MASVSRQVLAKAPGRRIGVVDVEVIVINQVLDGSADVERNHTLFFGKK